MMKAAPLGVVVIPVRAAADDHFTFVRLAHVAMYGVCHHNHIHAGFNRLGNKRLQSHGLNRQAKAGHIGHDPRMPRDHDPEFIAVNSTFCGLYSDNLTAGAAHSRHFALLYNIHAHVRAGPRIAPGNSIMACGAAARLPQSAKHRISGAINIDNGTQLFDLLRPDVLGGNTLQRIGMCGALISTNFMLGLGQHHHSAWTKHDVVIQILTERFIKAPRLFVYRGRCILKIVRPDNRRVAARVATAKPAFFKHGHIANAKITSQIIGRGQSMTACANNDHIIFCLWRRTAPGALPTTVKSQRLTGDSKGRISFH